MERRLVCEEKTERTVRKVFADEEWNVSEEFYIFIKGEMKRTNKTCWASFKNRDIYGPEDEELLDEFFKSKLGEDYKRVG